MQIPVSLFSLLRVAKRRAEGVGRSLNYYSLATWSRFVLFTDILIYQALNSYFILAVEASVVNIIGHGQQLIINLFVPTSAWCHQLIVSSNFAFVWRLTLGKPR